MMINHKLTVNTLPVKILSEIQKCCDHNYLQVLMLTKKEIYTFGVLYLNNNIFGFLGIFFYF